MESALYDIYALSVFVSEILLVRCAHSFDFWYVNNSCINTVPQHFPWSILYLTSLKFLNFSLKNFEITHKDTEHFHLKNISKNIISPHNLELVKNR